MKVIRKLSLLAVLLIQGCASSSWFNWFSDEDDEQQRSAQLQQEQQAMDALKAKRDMAELEVDPNNTMTLEGSRELTGQDDGQKALQAPVVESNSKAQVADERQLTRPTQAREGVQSSEFHRQFAHLAQSPIRASKQKQLKSSVENDYEVFRALNHDFIKNYTAPNQYKELERTLSHFVMDLVGNMTPELHMSPLVVRPLKLKVRNVANASGGKALITALIAAQMQDYGFTVFDGRKPKGKFLGDELILETHIESYGEQFVLYGTLRQLSSNKVAGTHQTFISDYFFRNIQDGVEVY